MHEFARHQLSYNRRHCDPRAGSTACRSHGAGENKAEEKGTFLVLDLNAVPTGVRCGRGVRLAVLRCNGCSLCRIYSSLGGVQVGLLLKLADVFLVPDALVAEPVGYLCERRAEEGGGAEESDIKQPQQRALSSGIVSRCHV